MYNKINNKTLDLRECVSKDINYSGIKCFKNNNVLSVNKQSLQDFLVNNAISITVFFVKNLI